MTENKRKSDSMDLNEKKRKIDEIVHGSVSKAIASAHQVKEKEKVKEKENEIKQFLMQSNEKEKNEGFNINSILNLINIDKLFRQGKNKKEKNKTGRKLYLFEMNNKERNKVFDIIFNLADSVKFTGEEKYKKEEKGGGYSSSSFPHYLGQEPNYFGTTNDPKFVEALAKLKKDFIKTTILSGESSENWIKKKMTYYHYKTSDEMKKRICEEIDAPPFYEGELYGLVVPEFFKGDEKIAKINPYENIVLFISDEEKIQLKEKGLWIKSLEE